MTRTRHAVASALLGLIALAAAPAARACYPWAEKVVAFDLAADVYIMASWHDSERAPSPPSAVVPNWYEARRISTGEKVAAHNCGDGEGAVGAASVTRPCDWRKVLALPRGASFERRGQPLASGRARVRLTRVPNGDSELALEARVRGAFRWVRWLDYRARGSLERVRDTIAESEVWQGEVALVLEAFSRGGNCTNTTTRMVRLEVADLGDPKAPGRQARLLARLDEGARFEEWQTAAELGPLPEAKLVPALIAAEREGRSDFGARWWREATRALPAERGAALARAIAQRQDLAGTRALLGL